MSDMKCPICGTILDKAFINDKIRGCPKCRNMGNIELWQVLIDTKNQLTVERTTHDILQEELKKLQDELTDTKKKLDIAVDALDAGRTLARIAGFEMLATGMDEAINKITALEQKD